MNQFHDPLTRQLLNFDIFYMQVLCYVWAARRILLLIKDKNRFGFQLALHFVVK